MIVSCVRGQMEGRILSPQFITHEVVVVVLVCLIAIINVQIENFNYANLNPYVDMYELHQDS